MDRVENTASQLLHCCLAEGVFVKPFRSNDCLLLALQFLARENLRKHCLRCGIKMAIVPGKYIVTCMIVYRRGFGLEISFINHFNIRLVTTLNCSNIADLHTLQITTAHAKFLVCCGFTSRSLVTASNIGNSSASPLSTLLSLLFTDSLTTLNSCSSVPHNISTRTKEKTPFIIVLQSFPYEHICLQWRYSDQESVA
jgi:hypothetical protein